MPLDPLGLMLIDKLLDAVVELRLLPDTWSGADATFLEIIHAQTLELNTLWQERDLMTFHDVLDFKSPLNSIYIFLLRMDFGEEKATKHPQFQQFTLLADLTHAIELHINQAFERNQNI